MKAKLDEAIYLKVVFEEILAKYFANKREENYESTGLDDFEDSDSENENNKEQEITNI